MHAWTMYTRCSLLFSSAWEQGCVWYSFLPRPYGKREMVWEQLLAHARLFPPYFWDSLHFLGFEGNSNWQYMAISHHLSMIQKYIGCICYRQFPNVNRFPGFSGNDRACANSQYRAVFLFPHSLGMRLRYNTNEVVISHFRICQLHDLLPPLVA